MRHVYLLNEGSRAAVYGIGTYLRQMIECLQSMPNVSINIVQFQSEKNEFSMESTENYRTYFFPKLLLGSRDDVNAYYQSTWTILQQYINLKEMDEAFFVLNYTQEYFLIPLIKKKFPNSFVFFAIHYLQWCFSINGNTSYFKRIISSEESLLANKNEKLIFEEFVYAKQMLKEIDMIICLSKYTKQLLLDCYQISERKISLIYNGLKDDAQFLSCMEKENLKNKLYLWKDEKIVLFVGRLDPEKGVSTLIKAFRIVIQEYQDCRLVIIGDGDYSSYLKECKDIWTKITFVGRVDKEELFRFYQIADIGVMQSTHEQCSYVAIEMMMHGIPLIVTNSTGLAEMVSSKSGFRVTVLEKENTVEISEKSLSSKILILLQSSQFCKKKGEYSRKRFEKYYSIMDMQRKIRNLFR